MSSFATVSILEGVQDKSCPSKVLKLSPLFNEGAQIFAVYGMSTFVSMFPSHVVRCVRLQVRPFQSGASLGIVFFSIERLRGRWVRGSTEPANPRTLKDMRDFINSALALQQLQNLD